jgi:hypothetical protein
VIQDESLISDNYHSQFLRKKNRRGLSINASDFMGGAKWFNGTGGGVGRPEYQGKKKSQ